MLTNSETSATSPRRAHRTYTAQFKAELVAACQQIGVSIAVLAGQHAMNANVLHSWLKEHERNGCHQLEGQRPAGALETMAPVAEFLSVQLPPAAPQPKSPEIKGELR